MSLDFNTNYVTYVFFYRDHTHPDTVKFFEKLNEHQLLEHVHVIGVDRHTERHLKSNEKNIIINHYPSIVKFQHNKYRVYQIHEVDRVMRKLKKVRDKN